MGIEQGELGKLFNAIFGLHALVAIVLLIAGGTLGIWFFESFLNIPDNLRSSALAVLYIAVITASLGALVVPYEALFTAHERFGMFAVLETVRALFLLGGSYWLLTFDGDRLLAYALIAGATTIGANFFGVIIATWTFPESRLRPSQLINRAIYRSQTHLFSWTLFGSLSAVARTQGFIILINIFFGPAASAALAIGNQLVSALRQIVSSITDALKPLTYKMEQSGARNEMIALSLTTAKYTSFATVLLAIPLLAQIDTVLALWLNIIPEFAAVASILLVLSFIVDQLSAPTSVVHLAIGRVARFQMVCGLTLISAIPLGYFVGLRYNDQSMVLVVLVAMSTLVTLLRIILLRPYSPNVLTEWIRSTVAPMLAVTSSGILTAVLVWHSLEPGIVQLIVTVTTCTFVILLATVFLGLTTTERNGLMTLLKKD